MSTSRKGKRVALVSLAVGMLVLGVTGYAFRDSLVEQYWLYRLEHGNEEVKKVAARELGSLRSARAIPSLVREVGLLQERYGPGVIRRVEASLPEPSSSTGFTRLGFEVIEASWAPNWAGHALVEIGPAAISPLFKELEAAEDQSLTRDGFGRGAWVYVTLLRIVTAWGEETLPSLQAEAHNADETVRRTVREAFESLLYHASPQTRRLAVCAAPEFFSAQPGLRYSLRGLAKRDPDQAVRCAATEALKKIEANALPR